MEKKHGKALQAGRTRLIAAAMAAAAGMAGADAQAQTQLSSFDQFRLMQTRALEMQQTKGLQQMNGDAVSALSTAPATALRVSPERLTGVILEVAEGTEASALELAGLTEYGSAGNYYFGKVSIDRIEELAACEGVKRLSLSRKRALLNDKARKEGRLGDVQSGEGLPQAYNGKGVVAGLMDQGLDPSHITFMDANGDTRVRRLWQFAESGRYRGYTDEDISGFTTDDRIQTHGTHVLGTIAGSWCSTDRGNDYHGVAPEADIAIGCGDFGDENILQAVRLISEYAREEGKPCVINLSIGDNFGPHDGTDEFTAALDALAADENTTVFIAAGNEGTEPIAVTKEFKEGDTMVQTLLMNGDKGNTQALGYIDVWGNDERPLKVYMDLYENDDYTAPVRSYEIPANGQYYVGSGSIWSSYIKERPELTDEVFNADYATALIGGAATVNGGNNRYYVSMIAHLREDTESGNKPIMALRVEGEPGQTAYVYTPLLYLNFINKGMAEFTQGGGNGTISNMGCGKETITIGSYCTNNIQQSYYGNIPEGNVSAFTSWGRLCDGRELPDFCAPGQVITSAENYYIVSSIGYDEQTTVRDANNRTKRHYWTSMGGTSMATPYATGVGALMLNADPTLTTAEIREIMKQTATRPEEPSMQWGAGKLNAYDAIKEVLRRLGYDGIGGVTDNAKGGISLAHRGGNSYEALAPDESRLAARVTSLSGATVKEVSGDGNCLPVDLDGLSAGVYVLTIEGERGRLVEKIAVK